MLDRIGGKFLETLGEIFIEWIVPLGTYGLIFIAFVLFGRYAVKHSWREKAKEEYDRLLLIKREVDRLITALPNRDTLEDEYLLHSVHLTETAAASYRKKFIIITERLNWASSKYAEVIVKPSITTASPAYAIIKHRNNLVLIRDTIYAGELQLSTLWQEIANPSLPISQLPTLKTDPELVEIPTTARRGLSDPLIKQDTWFADSVNCLYLRDVWRKPLTKSSTEQ